MSLSSSQNSANSLHRKLATSNNKKMAPSIDSIVPLGPADISHVCESTSIKKGVLWEQQQNRFFFNRWKERFFILTTDYLSCFKKTPRKAVGMSEMGSFVFKINLNEIKTLTWVDKKKNGVIGVQMANTVIFLWNSYEGLLDEWMTELQEATSRTKVRRETLRKSATLLPNMNGTVVDRSPLNLIERSSPSIFAVRAAGTTARSTRNREDIETNGNLSPFTQLVTTPEINFGHEGVVPPPPPPRRYIRCLSTAASLDPSSSVERQSQSPRPRSEKLSLADERGTFHKLNGNTSRSSFSENSTNGQFNGNDSEQENNSKNKEASVARKTKESLATQSLRVRSSYHLSPLITSSSPTTNISQQQPLRASTSKRLSAIGQFGSLYSQQQQQPLPPRPKPQTLSHQQQQSSRHSSQSMFRPIQQHHQQQPNPQRRARDVDDLFTTESSDFSFIATRSISIDPYQRNFNHSRVEHSGTPPPPLPPLPSHRSSSGSRLLPLRHSTISSSASLMLNGGGVGGRNRSRIALESGTFAGRGGRGTPPPLPPVPPHRTHIHHF